MIAYQSYTIHTLQGSVRYRDSYIFFYFFDFAFQPREVTLGVNTFSYILDCMSHYALQSVFVHTGSLGHGSKLDAAIASRRIELSKKIDILEQAALQTDSVIGEYILKGVISGLSYDSMKARIEIPCCKDMYYHLYRRFFWLLDRMRD